MDAQTLKTLIYETPLDGANMPHLIRDRHIDGYDEWNFAKSETLYEEQFGSPEAISYIDIALKMRGQLTELPMVLEGYLFKSLGMRRLVKPPNDVPSINNWLLEAALDARCKEDPTFFTQAAAIAVPALSKNATHQAWIEASIEAQRTCILTYLRRMISEDGIG